MDAYLFLRWHCSIVLCTRGGAPEGFLRTRELSLNSEHVHILPQMELSTQ